MKWNSLEAHEHLDQSRPTDRRGMPGLAESPSSGNCSLKSPISTGFVQGFSRPIMRRFQAIRARRHRHPGREVTRSIVSPGFTAVQPLLGIGSDSGQRILPQPECPRLSIDPPGERGAALLCPLEVGVHAHLAGAIGPPAQDQIDDEHAAMAAVRTGVEPADRRGRGDPGRFSRHRPRTAGSGSASRGSPPVSAAWRTSQRRSAAAA